MTPFYIGNLTKSQRAHSNRNIVLNVAFIVLIICSIFVYLIEVNSISTYSFKIEAIEQRIKELEANNQSLEIELGKKESMSSLDLWVEKLKLTKVAVVDYLTMPITAVAAK